MGFPIQTSPDQRFVGTSPKRIAASHVFHRHVEPRHPPYALKFPIRKSRNHFEPCAAYTHGFRLVDVSPLTHESTVCLSHLQFWLLTRTRKDSIELSNNVLYVYRRKNRLSAAQNDCSVRPRGLRSFVQ